MSQHNRRKRRKAAFFAGLGVAAVAGLLIVGAWYLLVLQLTDAQQARTVTLTVPPGAKALPCVATATDTGGQGSEFSPAFDVLFEDDFD